jgi:two-component system response regulator YesN
VYKLLVVDDEYNIRDGIANALPWDSIGVQVIGTAGCGRDALKLADSLKPDIVITDVKMDNMDGLSMSRVLRQNNPDLGMIFLSGYDEPQYIRQSMELRAFAYLLKPVRGKDLLNTAQRLISELDKRRQLTDRVHKLEVELDEARGHTPDGHTELSPHSRHTAQLIQKADGFMRQNLHRYDFSLDTVAEYLNLNPSYFSRVYKQETKTGFAEALTLMRMNEAKQMLLSSNKKITEIANACGYLNANYFCSVFKKHYGSSPTDYRYKTAVMS